MTRAPWLVLLMLLCHGAWAEDEVVEPPVPKAGAKAPPPSEPTEEERVQAEKDALSKASSEKNVQDHPLYQYLQQKREAEWFRRVFIGYSFAAWQLDVNTHANPVNIPNGNFIPAVGLNTEFWIYRNLGLRLRWNRGVLVFFPKRNATTGDSFNFFDMATADMSYRHYFQATSQGSWVQFSLGLHYFGTDYIPDSAFPFVKRNMGLVGSVERKLAFNNKTGIRANLDIVPLFYVLPTSSFPALIRGSTGLAFQASIELYHTILSQEGVETVVGLVLGQNTYIYQVTDTYKAAQSKNEYHQNYRMLMLQFAARI